MPRRAGPVRPAGPGATWPGPCCSPTTSSLEVIARAVPDAPTFLQTGQSRRGPARRSTPGRILRGMDRRRARPRPGRAGRLRLAARQQPSDIAMRPAVPSGWTWMVRSATWPAAGTASVRPATPRRRCRCTRLQCGVRPGRRTPSTFEVVRLSRAHGLHERRRRSGTSGAGPGSAMSQRPPGSSRRRPRRTILPEPRAFPALDGIRALAVAGGGRAPTRRTGPAATDAAWAAGLLARLDAGVAVFFVLSGFLLSRALVDRGRHGSARHLGRACTSGGAGLRILPVYWVAVVLAFAALPANRNVELGRLAAPSRVPADLSPGLGARRA